MIALHDYDWSGFAPGAADTTAPILSSPSGAATGETTAIGSVSTDEGNGTLYWIIDQSGTPPNVAQIQAGQGSDSLAADDSGNQSVSSVGTQGMAGSGLVDATTYYIYFQHQDASANDSTVISSSSFITGAVLAGGSGTFISNLNKMGLR